MQQLFLIVLAGKLKKIIFLTIHILNIYFVDCLFMNQGFFLFFCSKYFFFSQATLRQNTRIQASSVLTPYVIINTQH